MKPKKIYQNVANMKHEEQKLGVFELLTWHHSPKIFVRFVARQRARQGPSIKGRSGKVEENPPAPFVVKPVDWSLPKNNKHENKMCSSDENLKKMDDN